MGFLLAGRVLLTQTCLTPIEKLILVGLAEHADVETHRARPSVKTLRRYAECSERAAQNALRNLRESRWIDEVEPPGRHRATTYVINVELFPEHVMLKPRVHAVHPSSEPLPLMGAADDDHGCISRPVMGARGAPEPVRTEPVRTEPEVIALEKTSAHRELIKLYHDTFSERFGTKPQINGAKDGALLRTLLKSHGDDDVRANLSQFFESVDPFICRSGYTLGVFYAVYNKLSIERSSPMTGAQLPARTSSNVAAVRRALDRHNAR